MTPTSCPSEQILAVHADGELPYAQSRGLDDHVSGCPRCRALLEALRGETLLLARVLEEGLAPAPARRAVSVDLVTTGLLLLTAAAGLQALFGWLGGLGPEAPVDVDARSFVVSVLFDTFFYLVREGASMLTPLLSSFGFVAFVVVTALLGLAVRRRSTAGSLLLLVLVGFAAPAAALERRVAHGGHQEITVPAGETVDDSLFAVGDTVSIDGVVTGNVIACAQRVIVRGTVKGDLVTAGQRVELAGTVEGNVIGFSQTLIVRGPVGRSLHAFAEHVSLDREGRVEGDVVSFAGGLDFEGRAGRDLLAFGGFANLRGEVARNASSWTDRLRVDGPAKISGDLTAHAPKKENVTVDSQASVGGKSETRIETHRHQSRYARPAFYVWRVIWLAAAFLAGLLVHWLFPGLIATSLGGGLSIARALGVGFVALVAAPVAIVLVGLTMVGLPVAVLALLLWGAGVYLSSVFVGALLGRILLARPEGVAPSFAIALLVGLAVVSVAVHMPYVGWLLSPLVTLLGLGIGVIQTGRAWKVARTA
jgi:hypothetical protein